MDSECFQEIVKRALYGMAILIFMLVLFVGSLCYYLGSRGNSDHIDKSPKQVTDR